MKTLIFLLTIGLGLCYGTPINGRQNPRVVGGLPATNGAFPYQVSLRTRSNVHFCGGVVIFQRTILTAAHCIYMQQVNNTIVYVGTVTLDHGGTRYNAESFKVHPDYDYELISNDIALVIVHQNIVLEDSVAIIPVLQEEVGGGVSATLTGWGATSYPGGEISNVLQYVYLQTIEFEDCKRRLIGINAVFDHQICALSRIGQGACHGDSGGPLVADGYVIGITSWGFPCAAGYPDVFSRISSFSKWIDANKI